MPVWHGALLVFPNSMVQWDAPLTYFGGCVGNVEGKKGGSFPWTHIAQAGEFQNWSCPVSLRSSESLLSTIRVRHGACLLHGNKSKYGSVSMENHIADVVCFL